MHMIQIKNVTKKYGDKTAVDNLSLDIKDGEILGLLGPNGAGKSTTLKMITGITDITSGKIIIDGFDIKEKPEEAKECFGFVLDSPDMFLRLKAIDFLTYIGNIYGMDKNTLFKNIDEFSQLLDIKNNLNEYIKTFSHGMRQKIMVLASIIHEPKTWILDEPMTGLDPKSQHTIKELMKEHALKGNAVLFSTHVLETAEKLCDRVAIMNEGKLIAIDTLDNLKANSSQQDLEEIFLRMTANENE